MLLYKRIIKIIFSIINELTIFLSSLLLNIEISNNKRKGVEVTFKPIRNVKNSISSGFFAFFNGYKDVTNREFDTPKRKKICRNDIFVFKRI